VSQGEPRRLWWLLIPFLLLIFVNVGLGFLTDWAWYDSVGYVSVLATRVWASLGLFVAGSLVCWLLIAVNILIARRLEPFGLIGTPPEQIAAAFGLRVPMVLVLAAAVFSLFMGIGLAADWPQLLVFLNQTPFAVTDPIFGRDVSFFMFTLPVWGIVRGWLLAVVLASLVAVALTAGVGWRGWVVRSRVLVQMAVLGALALVLVAWQYRIDAFNLVYSERGSVFGGGYADIHAQLPAYNLLAIVTLVAAVLLIVAAVLRRGVRAIVVVLGIWVAIAVLAGGLYPALIQRFQVAPNEFTLERPYIEDNIAFTRLAFGLDEVVTQKYNASRTLTPESLLTEPETIRNVRLWDYRPLLQTYNQVQALRQYYEFNDVDVDRYTIDGRRQQVMIAARELVPDRLSVDAQTWVNRKLVYTHGFGVAMSPVAHVTADGLPEFFLKDLPVTGVISVTRPQLYFGELTNDYVIGRTKSEEFDFPQSNGNMTHRFEGDTGIGMSWWHRLLFAVRFADINLLLSQDILPESQLLWRRNIEERVQLLAPFLEFDKDPYVVVGEDGRLYWFIDAYTVSSLYPYSEPFRESLNYMRNPVKVVIDAYDGRTNFYVVEDDEPITAAYRKIFPALFKPITDLPVSLARHIRYPTDLFSVQAEMFRTYHMTNVTDFYNREDLWAWPEEIFYNEPQRMEPYYVMMQLPGSSDLDYVQILPFTPSNRENMIAWMAAQSDLEKYGQRLVYEFGPDSLFFGPKQVEARIDQDPTISAQLSLWNQQGSSVIRGNLLVIPIGESLLYVEPIYLQAESGKIPELKRVVIATADRVVMAENLGLALVKLFGRDLVNRAGLADLIVMPVVDVVDMEAAPGAAPATSPVVSVELATAGLDELIKAANDHYVRGQEFLRLGDWAGYGSEMTALQSVLEQMMQTAGVEIATPEVSPTPTPAVTP